MTRRPLGRFPRGTVRRTELPKADPSLVTALAELVDLTATISDVLDALGIVGAVPATTLRPAVPGSRMVGGAITVRNVERRESVAAAVASARNSMGDTEAYHLADPGDVVVIEGLPEVSNMGGQGFQLARRQGCIGAIVDGGYRDPGAPAELGFWSGAVGRRRSPASGAPRRSRSTAGSASAGCRWTLATSWQRTMPASASSRLTAQPTFSNAPA